MIGETPWVGANRVDRVRTGSDPADCRTTSPEITDDSVSAPDVDNRSADRPAVPDDAFEAALIEFIMTDVALDEGQIEGETDLLLTGLVDSLGVVLIVEWIETELARAIDPADVVLENFQTVDAMMEFLRSA